LVSERTLVVNERTRARVLRWSAWSPGLEDAAAWQRWAAAPGPLAGDGHPAVRTVFASRHGSINESIELLHAVVRQERLSPTRFSHTVHNAQAGMFCIAAGNRAASSSLAARADTFACGWLEALTFLERDPATPVLFVTSDMPLDPTFRELVPEPFGAYGLGLLLGRTGHAGPGYDLDLAGQGEPGARPWPDAVEFLRFLLAGEERLELGRFGFTRAA
jgi:Beta-ketoacyl synthase, N-terminal domain